MLADRYIRKCWKLLLFTFSNDGWRLRMIKFAKTLFNRAGSGQAINEMGLLISLVSVVSIGGLMYYSNQVATIYDGYGFGNGNNTTLASGGGTGSGSAGGGAGGAAGSGNGAGSGGAVGGTGTIQLSDGTMLNLGNYPTDLSKAVETTGVNGTTEQLLASLEALAASLAAEGKLTPEQTSAFTKLANLGHDVANIEEITESALAACGTDLNCVQNTPIVYNGTTYANVYQFSGNNLGFDEGYATDCYASATGCVGLETPTAQTILQSGIPSTGWSGASGNFANEYAALQSSGLLANAPELNSIVTALSSQILLMSDSLETKTGGLQWGTTTMTTWQSAIAADATDINSAGICASGGGMDTSNVCH